MKKYIFLLILPALFFFLSERTAAGQSGTIAKIALRYAGGTYTEYDIEDQSFDRSIYTLQYIATLTDESNNLPAGVITGIATYLNLGSGSTGWLQNHGSFSLTLNTGNEFNWLNDYEIDLNTIKRKKVTDRFSQESEEIVILQPSEEPL